jgi:hypothetical protein
MLMMHGIGYGCREIIYKLEGESKGKGGARKDILATPGLFLIPNMPPWVILMITNKIRIVII